MINETWFFLDGYNLSYRAFYALQSLTDKEGFPTGALHSFIKTAWALEALQAPHKTAIFFDKQGSKRHLEILPQYKANRSAPPEAFKLQLPIIKEICKALGYAIIEEAGVEADDLIASFAKNYKSVYLVSADKDLSQMINSRVKQYLPPSPANTKIGWRLLDESNVFEKFGVKATQISDLLALTGDSVDNIQGIKSVGYKTAAKWLNEFSTIDNMYENIENLKPDRFRNVLLENKALLERNKILVTLKDDFKTRPLENLPVDNIALGDIFKKYGLKSALKQLEEKQSSQLELF